MNKILLLGIGMLLCCDPAKGLICHACLDFRKGAGCIQPGTCKPAPGHMCQIEQIYMEDEVRQGCTTDLTVCSTTRLVGEPYGTITTLCCNHCDYCNED